MFLDKPNPVKGWLMMKKTLLRLPVKGFYMHYKHTPDGELHNYTYEVIGIARDTEDDSFSVLYLPLYKSLWLGPADYCSRPLEIFMGTVEIDGVLIPRFTHITDPKMVRVLKAVSVIMRRRLLE